MITKPTSVSELKQLFAETLMQKTSKVTKITDNSVLNGVAFGIAKVGQKALKDIALIESSIFPDSGFDTSLDDMAERYGISPRFTALGSSTFIKLVGDVGTEYIVGTHTCSGNNGIVFDFEENITIGDEGFTYAKVRSQQIGLSSKVQALTLTKITPIPLGHRFVVNEYEAIGGRDLEDDNAFRQRIKEGANILARGTLASIEQVFIKINSNILKVAYQGINDLGQTVIAVSTQNGVDLTISELDALLDGSQDFFSLTELRPHGTQFYGIEIRNIEYQPIDISFRVDLFPSFNPDDIRIDIQTRISKALDPRGWKPGESVQWDDLLNIVKSTRGVKYCPDNFFVPNTDIPIDPNKLPRVRGFLMLDLNGGVIVNLSGTLLPIYYPNKADFSFIATALRSI